MSGEWDDGVAGAFDEAPDAFGRSGTPTSNPLITREQDRVDQSPPVSAPAQNNIARPKAKVALVGIVDTLGAMHVARHVVKPNGDLKALEAPRKPNADEYNSIMFGGKLVQGGTVATNVATGTNIANQMQSTPLGALGEVITSKWKKWVLFGGLGLAAAGLGYVYLSKKSEGAEPEDIDDEDEE